MRPLQMPTAFIHDQNRANRKLQVKVGKYEAIGAWHVFETMLDYFDEEQIAKMLQTAYGMSEKEAWAFLDCYDSWDEVHEEPDVTSSEDENGRTYYHYC